MKKFDIFKVLMVAVLAFAWLTPAAAAPIDIGVAVVVDPVSTCDAIRIDSTLPGIECDALELQPRDDSWHSSLSLGDVSSAHDRAYDLYRRHWVPWSNYG